MGPDAVNQEDSPQPELRRAWQLLRRRKWTVLVACAAVVAAAVGASLAQTPVYEGTARLLIQTQGRDSVFDPVTGQRNDPARAVQSEILVIESAPVRAAVRQRLGEAPPVTASAIAETDGVEIKATDPDPRRAALVANTYGQAYIDVRRRQAVDALLATGKEIQAKVGELQTQIDDLNARIERLPAASQALEAQSLRAKRDSLLQQQALFRQKLDQVEVDTSLKSGGALLVTPASVPASPVRPQPVRDGLLALAVGLLLGVSLAFLLDHLDDSVKTKEDLEASAGALPVLGLIPSIPSWKHSAAPVVASVTEQTSATAEAYRSLRTSVQFLGFDRPISLLQVTSPTSGEGKTTTLANLAVALARAGQRVTMVCCDLRRPRIHEFFGLPNGVGLTSVLMGQVDVTDALQDVGQVEGLQLLASGPIPPNPSELLSSRRAVEVLTSLQAEADIVLLDCPPLLPVTDAAVLSGRVDGTLLVARAGSTTRGELSRTLELLHQVGAPVMGVVLNGVTSEAAYGYAYGYGGTDHASLPVSGRAQGAVAGSRV